MSVTGKVRKKNEDNIFMNGMILPEKHEDVSEFICSEREDSQRNLLAVLDGIGGTYYGEKASYEAAKIMQQIFRKADMNDRNGENFFTDLCNLMNEKICQLQEEYMTGMGTTMSALLFGKVAVTVCNLGDSPIFLVRDGQINRIHEEHTNRKFLQEHKINRKLELTQCLGIPEEEITICPYIHSQKLRDGDWYLICSDGLTDMVSDEEILAIILSRREHGEKVKVLIDRAMEQGGRDNTTIILINIRKEGEENEYEMVKENNNFGNIDNNDDWGIECKGCKL